MPRHLTILIPLLGLLLAPAAFAHRGPGFSDFSIPNGPNSPGPQYSETQTHYDSVGNIIASSDPLGHRTETDYDALGQPIRIRHVIPPAQQNRGYINNIYGSLQNNYISTGQLWQSIDEKGIVTETKYDSAGRPVLVTADANGLRATTQTIYDAAGNIAASINPLGKRTDYTFDSRNRKIGESLPAVLDANNNSNTRPKTTWEYDNVGNVIKTIAPKGNATETIYDAANRVIEVQAPAVEYSIPILQSSSITLQTRTARPVTRTTYDKNGNILTVTDPNGYVTTNKYDSLNHLITTTDAQGITVENTYDAVGNLIAVKDGKGQITTFEYDGLKRNTKKTNPLSQITTIAYDALNKVQEIDAGGRAAIFIYDDRNRLTNTQFPNAPSENKTSTYDKVGNVLTVVEPNKTNNGITNTAYTYDALRRQTSETSNGVTHQYQYDLAGNRLQTTYASKAQTSGTHRNITSTYDALNRLNTMTESGNRTTQYRYDLNGKIVQKVMPNGDVENITFDALNRSVTQEVTPTNSSTGTTGSTAAHHQFKHHYDLAGNVVQIAEEYPGGMSGIENRIVTNLYDAVNRLGVEFVTTTGSSGAISNTISTTYTYDAANNRTKRIIDGGINAGITDYTYNTFNQLTDYIEKELNGAIKKTSNITYDGSGNRSQCTTRDANNTIIKSDAYTFDQQNRLTALAQIHNGISKTYKYEYDHRTRRVIRDESLAGGVKTTISFSGGTSVQEYEGNALLPTVENIRGSDYGGGVGGLLYTIRGNTPSYTYENKRGDVIAKTDSSGLLTYQATYEAFGTRTQEHGYTLDRQHANTKDEDPTGLLNEGFRYRDLETGVFISADPAGFVDGPNVYTYVRQNPWTSFDPEGLASENPWEWIKEFVSTAPGAALDLVVGTVVGTVELIKKVATTPPSETAKNIKESVQNTVQEINDTTSAIAGEMKAQGASEVAKELGGAAWEGASTEGVDNLADGKKFGKIWGETAAVVGTAEVGGRVLSKAKSVALAGAGAAKAGATATTTRAVAESAGQVGTGLMTPSKFFGNKTAKQVSKTMQKKFGSPKSVRNGAETFYNSKTKRSFNVHTDPAHGPPHVDVRRRGGVPEKKYQLRKKNP